MTPLEDDDLHPGPREVGGARQAVVPTADDHGVVRLRPSPSCHVRNSIEPRPPNFRSFVPYFDTKRVGGPPEDRIARSLSVGSTGSSPRQAA